jgi:hypothetical protein
MKTIRTVGAALIALGIGMTGPVSATPKRPAAEGNDLVTKVIVDCHPDARLHYLPKYDRKVLHRHRQSDCRVVLVDPPEQAIDCHPDARLHYLPKYDRRVLHRHRQSDCRVVIVDQEDDYEDRPRDCHRDLRKHYLPEYGRSVYHKHVGESCRIKVYNPYQGSGPNRPDCVKLGPVLLCEN